ncbi:hypothetical protein NC651_036881 [Populus alba x Populus x berolinensis]|nr:hypothetical protein NC651_036881 [Populus alba x Populus x berolinensis]
MAMACVREKQLKNEKMKTDHAIAVHWEPPCFSCPFPLLYMNSSKGLGLPSSKI